MTDVSQMSQVSKAARWVGWIIGVLPALLLVMSGVMKLVKSADVVKGMADLGLPDRLALPLGVVELACTVIYLIPQTAVLGAILLTGYLGGAIATHVRLGEGFVVQTLLGVVFWLGVYLREPRLRTILPWRT